MSTTRLIYIGDHFYTESGTIMSPVYSEDGARYDWGTIQCDLQDGKLVTIRPATNAEYGHYARSLREIQKKRRASGNPEGDK